MKLLLLTNGREVKLDDSDFEWASNYSWTWIKSRRTRNGYAARFECSHGKSKTLLMHRELLKAPLGLITDHRNGNGLDNQRDNLRLLTNAQNRQGPIKKSLGATSRFRGVSWAKRSGKWLAQIGHNYKQICLGYFDSEVDAAEAYNLASKKYFGAIAQQNII